MSVNFKADVEWPDNQLLLPADLFNVTVPPSLPGWHVRAPKFVDVTRMNQLSRDTPGSSGGGQLSIVNGLVTRDLNIEFSNAGQWRRINQGPKGPGQYQFTGGDVLLKLKLGIWIIQYVNPDPADDYSVKIFALIYGHELLHVQDEIDIAQNWLPPQLPNQSVINKYLVQSQTYTYGTPSQLMVDVDREFQDHIRGRINGEVRHLWASETNRRAGLRDAPAEYAKVQSKVDDLRAMQINRPLRRRP